MQACISGRLATTRMQAIASRAGRDQGTEMARIAIALTSPSTQRSSAAAKDRTKPAIDSSVSLTRSAHA